MQKKLHLIGEVEIHHIEAIIEKLKLIDEHIKCDYHESTRDLVIVTENKLIIEKINQIIEELGLNIKIVERKRGRKPTNQEFEKRVFLFSDLKSVENSVFLVSYLLNDPQNREVKFDRNQKILSVETSDPFIFNKISHIVSGFDEEIIISESYSKQKHFDGYLMYRLFCTALLLLSIALITVTLDEPSILSKFAWIITYVLLATTNAKEMFKNLKEKSYYETENFVVLGSFLMFITGFKYEASLTLFMYQTLKKVFEKNYADLVRQMIKLVDQNTKIVKVKDQDVYIEKQVEEVKVDDIVLINSGDVCLFEGIVVEGEVTINTVLMDGHEQPIICQIGDTIASGAKIIAGGANLKIIKVYNQTKISELYQLTANDLKQQGALKVYEEKRKFVIMTTILVLGLLLFISGLWMNSILLLIGSSILVAFPPFVVAILKHFVYKFEMLVALKEDVIIKDEDSLALIIKQLRANRKIKQELQSLELNAHLGGFKRNEIMDQYGCIYDSVDHLKNVLNYINRFDQAWTKLRLYSLVTKFVMLVLLGVSIMNFTIFIFVVFAIDCFMYLSVVKLMNEKV